MIKLSNDTHFLVYLFAQFVDVQALWFRVVVSKVEDLPVLLV